MISKSKGAVSERGKSLAVLTPDGILWVMAHAHSSTVANVALQGYVAGWPDAYVTAAIRACNKSARS